MSLTGEPGALLQGRVRPAVTVTVLSSQHDRPTFCHHSVKDPASPTSSGFLFGVFQRQAVFEIVR